MAYPDDYNRIGWQERTERIPADYDPSPRKLSYEEQEMIKELQADWAKGINWEIEWANTEDEIRKEKEGEIEERFRDILIRAGYNFD